MTTTATEQGADLVQGEGLNQNQLAAQMWADLDAEEGESSPLREISGTTDGAVVEEPGTSQQQIANEEGTAAPADKAGAGAPDPYEGLPQAVRDELAALRRSNEQLTARMRANEGQIGGLKNQLQRNLAAAAQATREAGSAAPTQRQIAEAAHSGEAMKRLKEDYPQFGEALDEVLREQATEVAQLRQKLEDQHGVKLPDNVVTQEQFNEFVVHTTIAAAHPNWQKRCKEPSFGAWLESQPREVQRLADSDDPQDAIRLFDLDKQAREAKPAPQTQQTQRQQQRQQLIRRAATIPSGPSTSSIRQKDTSSMTDAEYWKYLDQLEAQQQQARH